jgi:hypothetical protein
MMRRMLLIAALLVAAPCLVPPAHAGVWHWVARRKAADRPWHGGYYHTQWGQPVALVVPPTAELQTRHSWGVANTDIRPIWHQFGRSYPGPYAGGLGFRPTPVWPYHTDQFGVYYVRGPWK